MSNIDLFQIEQSAGDRGHENSERIRKENLRLTRESEKDASQKNLFKAVDRIHASSKHKVHFEDTRNQAVKRLEKTIEANPILDDGDPIKTITRVPLVVFGLIGAFAIDFFLFGVMSSYLLSMQEANWVTRWVAKVVIPLTVVAIEAVVSSLLVRATLDRKRLTSFAWRTLSVAFVVFIGSYTGSMVIANEGADSIFDLEGGKLGLLLLIVSIAVLPHIVLLFGGKPGYEGKALLLIYGKRFLVRWYDRKYRKHFDKAVSHFTKFARMLSDHESYFDCEKWDMSTLFTAEARMTINDAMDAEIIPAPNAPPLRTNGTASRTKAEPKPDEQEVG